jgi:uncharacterized coiled-coil protein SlyX
MTVEPQMGLTFERVWAAIQEIAERQRETERTVKELAEKLKETERTIAEMNKELVEQRKETERTLKECNGTICDFGDTVRDMVEYVISFNLRKEFKALGYAFSKSSPHVKYKDPKTGKTIVEADALLENGDYVFAIDVEADPSIEDVEDHAKRMETLSDCAAVRNDKRGYIGAIAGGIMSEEVKSYALKRGFYVLERAGDTMTIAATPEAWKPRRW